jgi:hypothetical protein
MQKRVDVVGNEDGFIVGFLHQPPPEQSDQNATSDSTVIRGQ